MYRIVHNEATGLYRVENRGWFGWSFVTDPKTHDYLSFGDLESAKLWVRERTQTASEGRRWRVVSDCSV